MSLSFLAVLAKLAALLGIAASVVTQPACVRRAAGPVRAADAARLREDVEALAIELAPRDVSHPANLDAAADRIRRRFQEAGVSVADHLFTADRRTFRNVVASLGPETRERVVIGAHYDVCGVLPGADDNASGVAGLLELARLLANDALATRVELVAFANEEPPYFGSEAMGSAVHAASLRKAGVSVRAMLSLEMIGYFRSEPKSQTFPVPLLSLLYPSRGDFLVLAGRPSEIALTRRLKRAMSAATDLDVRSINAPSRFGGLDLSDHSSFWKAGYPALMVTDTAFFRNPNYHTADDTPDTLDYAAMAKAVSAIHQAVLELAR